MGDGGTSIPSSCRRGWGARRRIKPPSKSLLGKYPLHLESPWQPTVRSLLSAFFFILFFYFKRRGGRKEVPKGLSLGQGWILATRGSLCGLALRPVCVAVGFGWIFPPCSAQIQKGRHLFFWLCWEKSPSPGICGPCRWASLPGETLPAER